MMNPQTTINSFLRRYNKEDETIKSLPKRWKVDAEKALSGIETTRLSLSQKPSSLTKEDDDIWCWFSKRLTILALLPDLWVLDLSEVVKRKGVSGLVKECIGRESERRAFIRRVEEERKKSSH